MIVWGSIFAWLFFFEELPISNIFSSVFTHHSSELSQRLRGLLLIFNGNCCIMTEINSWDCQQMLNIELIDHSCKVVLYSLISAHSHGSSMKFTHRVRQLKEDLLHFWRNWNWIFDQSVSIDCNQSCNSIVLKFKLFQSWKQIFCSLLDIFMCVFRDHFDERFVFKQIESREIFSMFSKNVLNDVFYLRHIHTDLT